MSNRILAVSLSALALVSTPVLAGQGKDPHKGHDQRPTAHGQAHPGNSPKADGRHDNGRHLGWQKQAWKRGDRIPVSYLEPRYYVDDYRTYRLSNPPEGYRWVRPMDDRYLLVQVTTGLITQALGY